LIVVNIGCSGHSLIRRIVFSCASPCLLAFQLYLNWVSNTHTVFLTYVVCTLSLQRRQCTSAGYIINRGRGISRLDRLLESRSGWADAPPSTIFQSLKNYAKSDLVAGTPQLLVDFPRSN
jgi:hypothetical protein